MRHLRTSAARGLLATAVVLAVGLLLPAAAPRGASAADNGLWSIYPATAPGQTFIRPYFEPLLSPGVVLRDSFTISNKTAEPINIELYAADAYNTRDGGFALRTVDERSVDMGTWIHLPTNNITVPGKTAATVPFLILPPADATPGDHPGGIVALNTAPLVNNNGQVHVRQLQAVGVRVYGRVRGPLHPRLAVTDFHVRPHVGVGGLFGGGVGATVDYTVVNTGNIRLDPKVLLSVSPLIGGAHHRSHALPELLPHGSAVVEEHISSVIPFARLRARLSVSATETSTAASATRWVFPWPLLLVIAAVIVGIVWLRRRRRRGEGEQPARPPRSPDGGAAAPQEPQPDEPVPA